MDDGDSNRSTSTIRQLVLISSVTLFKKPLLSVHLAPRLAASLRPDRIQVQFMLFSCISSFSFCTQRLHVNLDKENGSDSVLFHHKLIDN